MLNATLIEQFFAPVVKGKRTATGRTEAVAAFLRDAGTAEREAIGQWIADMLSVETLVPDNYRQWRRLVHDSMAFVCSHLSFERLAPKIIEQVELPPDTPVESRLVKIIAQTPGLQKLGQVLARTRRLHPGLRAELQQLENGISDMRPETVRAMVAQELGTLFHAYQVELSEELLCEASVSAVIEFTWRNPGSGKRERGVFKVLKPHVPLCFAEDLKILQELAEFLTTRDREYGFSSREVPEMLDEVRLLLAHEVDFRREQVTLAEVNRIYKRKGSHAPAPIVQLCTDRVTAMSAERGVKVTDAFRNSPRMRRRIASQIVESLIADPMLSDEDQAIFHADPHAGNLLYDESRQELIVLDWALTGRLGNDERRQLALLISSMTFRDAGGVREAIQSLSVPPGDRASARTIEQCVARFFAALPHACSLGAIDAMRLLDQIGIEGVRFPPELVFIRKVLFTLDGVLHDIAGDDFRMDAVILREFAERWLTRRGSLPGPLTFADFVAIQASALRYLTGMWALPSPAPNG